MSKITWRKRDLGKNVTVFSGRLNHTPGYVLKQVADFARYIWPDVPDEGELGFTNYRAVEIEPGRQIVIRANRVHNTGKEVVTERLPADVMEVTIINFEHPDTVQEGLDAATFEDKRRYLELLDARGTLVLKMERSDLHPMQIGRATAFANSNIALIKYWGDRDHALRLPANSSLSMNLAALTTTTTVEFRADLADDAATIGDVAAQGAARERVVAHLDRVRALAGINTKASVVSRNNFPAGTGLASSASAFAALTVAACAAAGLELSTDELSRLARRASGSACRSVPGGFVLWDACDEDDCSFGRTIAPAAHWDLRDVVAIVESAHKAIGSTEGHALADTSPLQAARVASTPARLERCQAALLSRDFPALADVIEQDTLAMHAVMMTSAPSLLYWRPATLAVMRAVRAWRDDGLSVAFTIDAGPNVHCICPAASAAQVETLAREIPGVERVLTSSVGSGSRLIL